MCLLVPFEWSGKDLAAVEERLLELLHRLEKPAETSAACKQGVTEECARLLCLLCLFYSCVCLV